MPDRDDKDDVLTPGGRRRASVVHHVDPKHTVTGAGKMATVEKMPNGRERVPPGMQPEEHESDVALDEPPGMRPPAGTTARVERASADASDTSGSATVPPGMMPEGAMQDETSRDTAPQGATSEGEAPDGMMPGGTMPGGMLPHRMTPVEPQGAERASRSARSPRPPEIRYTAQPSSGVQAGTTADAAVEELPRGMRPETAPLGVGEPTTAMGAAGARSGETAAAQALLLTPGGYRQSSLVRHVRPEHALDVSDDLLREIQRHTGTVVAEHGMLRRRETGRPLMPGNVARHPDRLPALGSGWIAYASWTNNTGHPVSRFATTWVVPPAPATDHGQTIFLFNGIQNSTMIYQPVLQWGPSAAGGGSYWSIASWYVDGQGGPAFHSDLIRVNPGDVLVGVMTLTGQSGNRFSYNCEFQGIQNSNLRITNVEELTWNIETLEAYGVQQCSDYPDTNFTAFTGIDLQTTTGRPALSWSATNAVTDCGQSARVVSNANPGGEVDIYYLRRVDASACTAAINSDGRLEVFLRATDGSSWNVWQTRPHAGPWSRIGALGGIILQPVSEALNSDGRLELFGIGTDHAAYDIWQTAPHAGPWSGWNRLGGWVSQLAAARNSDGRLELFGIGGDGALYDMWQTVPHAGPWSGWNRLGGWVKQICASVNSDGRLEVFGIGADNAAYDIWQTVPHAGPWSGWNRLGGWVKQIAAILNSDGRLELFGIGADDALYNMWQTVPHAGPWSGWNRLGGVVKQIVPTRNSDGRLEVFAIGSDNAVYNIWQTVPHAGPWSGWNRLGGWVRQISAFLNSDGRLEVFGIGSDASLYNIWQTVPHAGPWSSWNRLT